MYQLRQLRSVKRSLTLDSRRALATVFVASRIDYTATVYYTVSRKEKFSDFKWFWTLLRDSSLVRGSSATSPIILRDVLPLAPCTEPNQLQNPHTSSGLYSRHRPGLFRWRLCSGDCSPWTNQRAFSDAWRSCDPPNTNTIGRTEFPYIRTDGVELAPWFAQAFCYKPRTFLKRTENIPV